MAIDSLSWRMATGVRISALSLGLLIGEALPLSAQVNDQREDGNSARYDAMFGTPNPYTPTPPTNVFATTPGQEQQVPRSQFIVNGLAPFFFNSNAEAMASPAGGTNSAEFSPIVGASWSTPVFDLPFKFTGTARAEFERFTQAPNADFDKVRLSARLQYVDPDDDQAFSPYLSYSPRWDFAPFYKSWFETRQDLTVGINKIFNYDANFRRVPFSGNTFAETTWSLGVTVGFQRRFTTPTPGSWAVFLVPSASYVISPQWNISLGAYMERRGFDFYQGVSDEDWFIEPIATLEFVLPSRWFGSDANAALIGRPALDFQVAYERNWSTLAAFNYGQWTVGGALKFGWRF